MAEARAAASEEAASKICDEELGGRVYGFGTLFAATRKHLLTPPNTTGTLKKLLREHLYVEGAADENVRLDDHSFRVRTDDDEVGLAYFIFDDETAVNNPDRLAWPGITYVRVTPTWMRFCDYTVMPPSIVEWSMTTQ